MNKVLSLVRENIVHLFASFKYSWGGLRTCFRDETAFRQEICCGGVHFVLLLALQLAAVIRVYLTILYVMILTIELINTAVEAAVDCSVREKHPLAKKAKDCASAAVFCVIATFIISWVMVLADYFF